MRRALPHLQMAVLTAVAVGAIVLGIVMAPSGNPKPFAVTSPRDPAATAKLRAAAAATANAQSYTVTANENVTVSGRASSVIVQILYQAPDNIEISTPAGVAAIFVGNTEYSPSPTFAAPGAANPTGQQAQQKWLASPISALNSSAQEQQNPGALFLKVLQYVPGVHKVGDLYEASGSGIVRSALRAGVSGASSLAGEASSSATITATIVGGFVHLVTFSGTTPGRTYSVDVSYEQVDSSAPVTAPPASLIVNP